MVRGGSRTFLYVRGVIEGNGKMRKILDPPRSNYSNGNKVGIILKEISLILIFLCLSKTLDSSNLFSLIDLHTKFLSKTSLNS